MTDRTETTADLPLTSPVVARAMVRFWRKFADRADVRADPERRENALAMAQEWEAENGK